MTTFEDILLDWVEAIDGDVVLAVEASNLIHKTKKDHPGVLDQWLLDRASLVVVDRMGDMLRSRRATSTRRSASRAFASAAERLEATEDERVLQVPDQGPGQEPTSERTTRDDRNV